VSPFDYYTLADKAASTSVFLPESFRICASAKRNAFTLALLEVSPIKPTRQILPLSGPRLVPLSSSYRRHQAAARFPERSPTKFGASTLVDVVCADDERHYRFAVQVKRRTQVTFDFDGVDCAPVVGRKALDFMRPQPGDRRDPL
jgi:hypothetical protein